ncbi:hypothetical protein QUB19_26790 [Microcoleus sp. B4-C5]|uniref:hypothetical protein n=1 Tax=unclassified Microcoleus TaxID=2642155 RepID=UPI002FD18A26
MKQTEGGECQAQSSTSEGKEAGFVDRRCLISPDCLWEMPVFFCGNCGEVDRTIVEIS